MSPRLAGAALALTAAALLAISIVTSAWWAGHPSVDGRTIEKKTVHVGLHGAEGCNTGGDGGCTTLDLPDSFTISGYVAAGAIGLLALAVILMAITTLKLAEARKTLSIVVFVLVAIAVAAAAALVMQGPEVGKASQNIVIPIGYGLYVFAAGVVTAVLAGVLARRPAPKVELRPSRAVIAPALSAPQPQPQQPVDVLAFLQDDGLRPTAQMSGSPHYGAEPRVGGPSSYAAGNGPALPTSPPIPTPRASVSAIAGIPTPAPTAPTPSSSSAIETRTKPASIAPPPPRTNPPAPPRTNPPAPRTSPPSTPPRTNPLSTPPRTNPPSTPPRTKPVSVPPPPGVPTFGTAEPPRTNPISVPPPPAAPGPRMRAGTSPPPPGAIAARLKASSVPPPVRPGAMPKPPDPTAVPIAPITPKTLVGPVPPTPKPVVATKLPVRAETDPSELAETVDRDAANVGDATDANVSLPPESEHTSPSEPLDTEEAPAVRPPTDTDAVSTVAIPKEEPPRQSLSEIETIARERLSSRELATGDSTDETKAEPAGAPEVAAAAPAAEAPKIPITTAPSSLPPPIEKPAAATSGPSPACPQCEAPMAWVEEHLRFYCKSCRMYF